MADWRGKLTRVAHSLERRWDTPRRQSAWRPGQQMRIETYLGWGTAESLILRGRVLRGKPLPPALPTDSRWTNLKNAWRRFETDEVPAARVRAFRNGQSGVATADEEGFWEIAFPRALYSSEEGWDEVDVELLQPRPADPVRATARALVPSPVARFGVISDLDDTVLRTDARRIDRILRQVLLGNVHTRLPFPGVAEFYAALHAGVPGVRNPIFYVSSSPWNLYDVLVDFLELQSIPPGPLFLRDWGISERELLPTGHGSHKRAAIERILAAYPALPFLLIGDSGQEDPEIYHRVVHDFPESIAAVYIRNVSPAPERGEAIRALAAEVEDAGSVLLLADDTLAAAEHAAERGWIRPAAVPGIRTAVAGESTEPTSRATERVNRELSTEAT
ncbi:App1 family protein [soil metagenome]